MMWKIYFLFVIGLSGPTFLMQDYTRTEDIANVLFFILSLVGLFGYVWEQRILGRRLWQAFVPVFIVWNVSYHYLTPKSSHHLYLMRQLHLSSTTVASLCVIVLLPMLNALWSYAFEKNRIWKPFPIPAYLKNAQPSHTTEVGRHDGEDGWTGADSTGQRKSI